MYCTVPCRCGVGHGDAFGESLLASSGTVLLIYQYFMLTVFYLVNIFNIVGW